MKLIIIISILLVVFLITFCSSDKSVIVIQFNTFSVNNDVGVTYVPSVNLKLDAVNADSMIVSLTSSFEGASWQTYSNETYITLPNAGYFTVYAKVKSGEYESTVKSGSLQYIGDERSFWTYNFTLNSYERSSMVKVGDENNVLVYCQKIYIDYVNFRNIMCLTKFFDKYTYPSTVSTFGEPHDVDGNNKVILCLYNIEVPITTTSTIQQAGGFYNCLDYYSETTANTTYGGHSNEADIIYLDFVTVNTMCKFTVNIPAHHLQHMINFYRNVIIENSNDMSTFINEGLSTIAENVIPELNEDQYSKIRYQSYIYSDPRDYIKRGHPLVKWQYTSEAYSLSHLLLYYFVAQSKTGLNILKEIIEDSLNGPECLVNTAVRHQIISPKGYWIELMTNWLTANYLKLSSGVYGYNGIDLFTIPGFLDLTNSSINLLPGGAVYRPISSPFTPSNSASDIQYFAIDPINHTVSSTAPFNSGVLVCFNSSTDESSGTSQSTGILPIMQTPANYSLKTGYEDLCGNVPDPSLLDADFIKGFPLVIPDCPKTTNRRP